ncbi:MAG: hypothetical protein LBB43_00825 [Spirochaetaceae bacterium]|jgi:hypothetical protein|nr:hypothetical protein [Spirochaetaceae bacterium]
MYPVSETPSSFEGEHISAHFGRGNTISIRNKDNICSATVAYNQTKWGAAKAWQLFMAEVSHSDRFADAVDYFERHGIKMAVSG